MRLRNKILNSQLPVVVYEIIPPRIVDGTIESYSEKISSLLSQTHIDAINIPEIHAEESRGKRPVGDRVRAEPREFGRLIQESVGIEAIVNRVCVHGGFEQQEEWFRSTLDEFGIENFVIVGGESSEINYPGPNVIESAKMLREITLEDKTEIFLGGICLPSRKNESERMLRKSQNGVEFFTTQVIYDSEDVSKMIGHYERACENSGVSPKRILLSFAPISTKKNLDFLKWLGVEIPEPTEKYIFEEPGEINNRSIEVSTKILDEIIQHINEHEIMVPIGLNIEHIMTYNFQHSVDLLQKMSMKYRKFCLNG
jgi:5,10-methylenetetrahydrofolate reductase